MRPRVDRIRTDLLLVARDRTALANVAVEIKVK